MSHERVYEWEVAEVGHESPPITLEVTAENIASYCRGVRYESPVYFSEGSAKAVGLPGIVAPPTMVYSYAPLRRHEMMRSLDYTPPEEAASPRSTPFVGSEIEFQGVFVRPGDAITSVTRLVDKFERKGNRFLTFQVTAHNQRGDLVAQYSYTCLWWYGKGQKARETRGFSS